MGMSTHVIGFIPDNDSVYLKHKKVLEACIEAGIKELPKETAEYFGSKSPYEGLLEEKLQVTVPVKEWGNEYSSGYEVEVNQIPQGVKTIRFYNSW
jgi:hypothetical protein